MDDRAGRQTFLALQAYRGIAAVLVVLFHVSHSIFGTQKYWPQRPFGTVFEFGHAGVEFFFVLSGFIIYAVHRRDVGHAARLRSFAVKRIRRIYPAYWIVLLLIIPVFALARTTGTGMERVPAIWLDSLLLVHVLRGGGQVLSVSWTLFHEVLFYAVFALLILNRRLGVVVLVLWMLASVLTYAGGVGTSEALQFYFSPLHLLFAMGMLAAWATDGPRRAPAPRLVLSAGVAIFSAASVAEVCGVPSSPTMSLGYGLGSALVVVGSVELERAGLLRVGQLLRRLGDASYSIYLTHILALSITTKLLRMAMAHGAPIPLGVVFVLLSLVGVAAGLAYHYVVEAPLLRWLGRKAFFSEEKKQKTFGVLSRTQ